MNARDEDRELIWCALRDQYLASAVEELWADLNRDGDGLSGAEIAIVLNGDDQDRSARAELLLTLIEQRIEEAARGKADDEVEAVMRAQSHRGWNLLRGKEREDAEDLS